MTVLAGGRAGAAAAPLRLGWALAALAWAAAAAWIFAHPPALSSDDALYLARGLERFSILDQSPQFPGYPGFILLGRLLLPPAGGALPALALLAGGLALAIPPLAALIVVRTAGPVAALAAFLATLAMPLLPELALGLLTDGAGIAFTLVFLALLPPRAARPAAAAPALVLAGMALAWAAACRPSDAALVLAAAGGALAALPRRSLGPLALGAGAVLLPVAAGLLIAEPLYLVEGWRFTLGHALYWGNTPFSEAPRGATWGEVLRARPALALLLLLPLPAALAALVRRGSPAATAAAAGFLGHGLWILGFQNADNLRHLGPLLALGPVLLGLAPGRLARAATCAALGLGLALLAATATPDPAAAPPLAQAAERLRQAPAGSAVATNLGVSTLRATVPELRVYDRFYGADAALGLSLATGEAWRLTATPAPGLTAAARFPARFLGERTLWLLPHEPGRASR